MYGRRILKSKDVSTVTYSKEKWTELAESQSEMGVVTRETLGKAPPTYAI